MVGDRPAVPSDDELVRAVAAGAQDALATLYDRYAEPIHRLAVRLTNDRGLAEEIVQETFLALWNRAELFDPVSGSVATWLRTIARNRAIDRLRAAGRRPRPAGPSLGAASDERLDRLAGMPDPGDAADPGAVPERAAELDELRTALGNALAAMPDLERRVILFAYRDGLSQSEIAARLGWPLGTVKTRTRRALQRLRAALGGSGFEVGVVSEPGSGSVPASFGAATADPATSDVATSDHSSAEPAASEVVER